MSITDEKTQLSLNRTSLKGMSLEQLREWSQIQGQPAYRGTQIFEWMYGHGISDPELMENLPHALRLRLEASGPLSTASIIERTTTASEPTIKYLIQLEDGRRIETVSMIKGDRHTVCVSSQVGCNVGCGFCATAAMGLERNLSAGEIVDQVLLVKKERKQPITNVVFMGMGEPLLNYQRVLQAADILHHEKGLGLGAGRITISTAGIVPQIDQFVAQDRPYKLAISLNATSDETRERLMPLNRTWPLKELLRAARAYANRPRRTITFEYVLLAGENDSLDDARRLIGMLKGMSCKVNVIPYNYIGDRYQRPADMAIADFVDELSRGDFPVLIRWSNGADIAAGCGQLAAQAV